MEDERGTILWWNDGDILIAQPTMIRIDVITTKYFNEQMSEILNEESSKLVLNMAQIMHIDSSGIGALIGLMKKFGRDFIALSDVRKGVKKILGVARLDKVFSIHDDELKAVEWLKQQ